MMYRIGGRLIFDLYGKSHGPCVGAVLEGFPAGMEVDFDLLNEEMSLRKPTGRIGTPRRESDTPEFKEGLTDGVTDGGNIRIEIANKDTDGSKYMKFYDTPRPGHADLPALLKFPNHDLRGSGQFSGRLTAAMVAAGALAKQYLSARGIEIQAYSKSIGDVRDVNVRDPEEIRGSRMFPTRACDAETDKRMRLCIEKAGAEGDSVGGVAECVITGLPISFGGIWFEALDAELAHSMFGIPACKGIEFGDGFALAGMNGSVSNDPYRYENGSIVTTTNHLGGIVGGMCDGSPVVFRVVFKATPSIGKCQDTVNLKTGGNDTVEVTGRHDPCIVPRAVAVVEAMAAITIMDQLLRE